jgi:hypothetical protein
MHRFKLDQIKSLFSRYCLLGCLLWGLWGCGAVPNKAAVLQPNSDWQTLQSTAVQLDIPPGYVGGEPGRQLEELQATLEAWGFGDRAEWLAQNADKIELLAFQAQVDPAEPSAPLNSINLVQVDRPEQLGVLDYLQTQAAQLKAAGITIDRLNQSGEVGQLQSHREGLFQISYVYPTETVFWVLTYSSNEPDAALLSQIERSHQSLQILPEIPES